MSKAVLKTFYVDCPNCHVPVPVLIGENTPRQNHMCVTTCDICLTHFGLLSYDYCKTCIERVACMYFPTTDLINILVKEKVMKIDYQTGGLIFT